MSRVTRHYGIRLPSTVVPCVHITETFPSTMVVHKTYGLTTQHAVNRALKWMRQHGDPR